MKPKLHSFVVAFVFGMLVLINSASSVVIPSFQQITATPTLTPSPPASGPAGDTNGIAFLGILIFTVIVLAIMMRLREWRVH
ncbi:MAG: hypothetical protein DDG60_14800 [Anaerolineae bacterium]|nr:MAG: hypothetical protein DDG60_14800 [Anaerolineae bacterium]